MKILYFAPIPYDGLKQRPQYLAEELAEENEVIYTEPTVSLMKYLLKGGERPDRRERKISERLHILRLSGWMTAHRSLEAISPLLCTSEQHQLKPVLSQADMVWVGYAPWYHMLRGFSGRVVYDKMDEDWCITKNGMMKRLIERVEPKLIDRSEMVFVTAQRFYDGIHPKKERTYLVRNATDMCQINACKPAMEKEHCTRVFGYVGMISHWFDMDVIETILEADENNRVVLVGPTNIPRLKHPRLMYVGEVPKEAVGSWIESFDICLYPFQRTKLLETINPVKIYEYLAHNKPVLAVKSQEILQFDGLVHIYDDIDKLMEILKEENLSMPFSDEKSRVCFVLENSWEQRGETIRRLIKG